MKYFVNQNGGEIYIESEEHKGTTVIFTLPLADDSLY
ncbi:MAG TPA: ATP-binding protein [Bacteroidia bacterium]|nr:ATP-binding protein [Bacteroidia bacterium]